MGKPEPDIEIIDRHEDENGDYTFTFIMTMPSAEEGE